MIKYFEKYRAVMFLLATCIIFTGCAEPELTLEESLRMVNQHLETGRTAEAINLLRTLDIKFPDRIEVLEPLSFLYAEKQNHALAARYFAKAAHASPIRLEFFLYAAQSHRLADDPHGAARQYRLYLESSPGDASVWKTLGELQHELGDINAAINDYLESYRHHANGETAVRLGMLFDRVNNRPQAESWYQTALRLKDGAGDTALLGLLELAIKQKDFTTAEILVQKLDGDYPDRLDVSPLASKRLELKQWRAQQDALALELEQQKQVATDLSEHAVETQREAEKPDFPVNSEPMETEPVSQSVESSNIADKTREPARQTAAPPAKHPRILLAQARRHTEYAQYPEAIKKYRAILNIDDRSAKVWSELADAYLSDNQPLWARLMSLEAVRRDPADLVHTLQYLQLTRQTQTPERFFHEISQAKKNFPQSPEITLALARAYNTIMSNPRHAAVLYREFLEMASNNPGRAEAEAELQALQQP